MDKELAPFLPHAVVRQLLLGRRESLTIAGELGVPVAAVNEALLRLRDLCNGCITLHQPYAGDPRFIVVLVGWWQADTACRGHRWVSLLNGLLVPLYRSVATSFRPIAF